MLQIQRLTADRVRAYARELGAVLLDCVEGGASVSFLLGFSSANAAAFFEDVARKVAEEDRALLAAFDGGRLVGAVQVVLAMPPNQPHRGEISKLLVHRMGRRRGVATALMRQAEELARQAGKTLLVLDTATGQPAEALYERLGWMKLGSIPGFALLPNGQLCGSTIFWKRIA